ncbi:hypothetical protein DBR42_04835 [Pelomonas sp. HMWF004]|nr:hypothetical protein DBR42_04835 [Pelomonas sp. HMWF004]
MVRLSDATHGFVAIDDLEKVMAKRGGDPKFVDIAQTLKLSYKKQSAQKVLTDVSKDNALTRINFFGLKLINNTSGVDEILGSRMLMIATRTMPTSSTLPRDRWLDREQRATLRDALHTWAFCHVDDIARAYVQTSPNKSVRAEEIFAPLRVVASLSDSEQWRTDVERALGKGRSADVSSADVMKEAILGILIRSITGAKRLRTVLTVTEVKMHMQLLEGGRFGKSSTTEIADIESPVWIGRQFRQVFGRDDAERPRFRMYGHFVRAWAIHPTLLDQAVAQGSVPREELIETDDPQEFCQVCATCDYGALCEIRSSKEPREAPLELRKAGRKAVGNRAGPDAGLH